MSSLCQFPSSLLSLTPRLPRPSPSPLLSHLPFRVYGHLIRAGVWLYTSAAHEYMIATSLSGVHRGARLCGGLPVGEQSVSWAFMLIQADPSG